MNRLYDIDRLLINIVYFSRKNYGKKQFGKWIQFEKVQFSKNVACPASLLRLTFLNAWNNVCILDCKKRSLQFRMVLQIMHFYYFNSNRQMFFSKFNPFKCYTTLFWENNTTLKLHKIFNKKEVIMVCTLLADPFFAKATSPSYRLWVHSIRFYEFSVQLWRFLIKNDASL